MSRAGSSGGGRSSLGYLFEPEEVLPPRTTKTRRTAAAASTTTTEKAATTENSSVHHHHDDDKMMAAAAAVEADQDPCDLPAPPLAKRGDHSNPIVSLRPAASIIYHTNQSGSSSSGLLITDRPSTRVRCAPGGPSSLGFLFGDERH